MNTQTSSIQFALSALAAALIVNLVCAPAAAQSGGSSSSSSQKNKKPTVRLAAPSQVDVGGVVVVSATAEDPNGDQLSYSWSLTQKPDESDAKLTGSGSSGKFKTDSKGAFTVSVTVKDGNGGSATAEAEVRSLSLAGPERDHLYVTQRRSQTNARSLKKLREGLASEEEARKKIRKDFESADAELRSSLEDERKARKAADEKVAKRDQKLAGAIGREAEKRRQLGEEVDEVRETTEDLAAPISGSIGLGGGVRTFEDPSATRVLGVGRLDGSGAVEFGLSGFGLRGNLGVEVGGSDVSEHVGLLVGAGPWGRLGDAPLRLSAVAESRISLAGKSPHGLAIFGRLAGRFPSCEFLGGSARVGYDPLGRGIIAGASLRWFWGWSDHPTSE